MTKRERAEYVRQQLNRRYPRVDPPLENEDPYTLLVSVVLSQRCTDKKVNEITPHLFALANTPEEMAKLTPAEIRKIIKPCGLSPAKAKNIHAFSKLLIERHGSRVPQSFDELEALPGVGHKTASVVMGQAFRRPAFPVDTHIHRLAARWKLSSGKSVEETERDLKRLYPESSWHKLHLQIIFYGREYCTARGCDGRTCPICAGLRGERKSGLSRRSK